MSSIVQIENPILREKAKEVKVDDIYSSKIQKIISRMKEAVKSQKDGVAIAAPQIGECLRIFLVSDAMLKEADQNYKSLGKDLVFINPIITKLSRQKQEMEEGCLSVRWKYGIVKRAMKASIKAYDEEGKTVERGASGLLAQVFQHEIDHLNGILFTDKARDVQDIPPENIEKKINEKK